MYKRIIHNIVEEHYGDDSRSEVLVKGNQRLVKAASGLQLTIDQIITLLVTNMKLYIATAVGSIGSSAEFKNKVIYDINELGKILDGFYGSGSSTSMIDHLKSFLDSMDRIIILAKTGADYADEFAAGLTHIDAAATAISDLNSEHWPESIVKQYLRAYAGLLVDQVVARIKENWAMDTSFANYANRIMFNGPVAINTQQGLPDFAELLAAGIFKQFPQRF
jgi:hypothetical protein